MKLRWLWMIMALTAGIIVAIPNEGSAADFVVYSVAKELDMGIQGQTPHKDYYVNMGTTHGLRAGSTLEVLRKMPTYDLMTEKLYRDVSFPIAKLKVIHVESSAAVCRLESVLPADKTPVVNPRAVMVGDIVRIAE